MTASQDRSAAERIERLESEIEDLKAAMAEGVSTRRVRLVDADGEARAVLEADKDGPTIVLHDTVGTVRMRLALGSAGPGLTLSDEDGHTRAWLGFSNEALRIGFADDKGNSRAFFGVMRSGNPVARFYDAEGKVVWSAE
ncbi:MAG: hypothetical protein AAFX79_08615 [Planctomycetota bacterium]